MVNDVVSAKNPRISEKITKLLRIRRMNHGTVRTDSTYVMNPPILNTDLKIDEHNSIITMGHLLLTTSAALFQF